MDNKSLNDCIASILIDIEKRKTVDYTDKKSIRRYNAAMDRIVSNIKYIENNCPSCIESIIDFLNNPDQAVSGTFASLIFNMKNATLEHKMKCLSTAKSIINNSQTSSLNRVGWQYRARQMEDEINRFIAATEPI